MAMDPQLPSWSSELEKLARALNRVGPDEVCCEGLTPRQCSILRTLIDKSGARLSDLAADAGITPSAMTRVLDRLEKQELVQRVRGNQNDGRAAKVAITSKGREVRARIDKLMLERTKSIVGAVPEGFRPQLLASLRVLNQSFEPGGCCEFTGEWPAISVTCKVQPPSTSHPRRKNHAG
jgi:DNA-binding MarR family transcriptional regulator